MANHYETLEVERSGRVATVWMNRPEVFNAFNEQLIAELAAACAELDADAGVRVVVLAGRIQGVILETGDFITREGVKVGSTRAEVLRVFGTTFRTEPERIWYDIRGIGFWFQGDRVRQIQVVSGRR